MAHLRWVLLAGVLAARPAAAAPACTDALDAWLADVKADAAQGAVMSDGVAPLVAIPLRKTVPPKQSAMTIVVDKAGLHDGDKVRPPRDAKALIDANANISFGRSNTNALAHGILVAAAADAPAASVKAAVLAAVASKEPVWLVFRPSDQKTKAPPESPLTKELAPISTKDVDKFVKLVIRELGQCPGMMGVLQKLGGEAESARMAALVGELPAELKKCNCKPSVDRVASILWTMAFKNLGVLVAVKDPAKLPWGDVKATWADAAPAIVKAL